LLGSALWVKIGANHALGLIQEEINLRLGLNSFPCRYDCVFVEVRECGMVSMTLPLTETSPSRIISSQFRLDATPAADNIFVNRSLAIVLLQIPVAGNFAQIDGNSVF